MSTVDNTHIVSIAISCLRIPFGNCIKCIHTIRIKIGDRSDIIFIYYPSNGLKADW